jgi:hypothetical protein
MSYFTAESEALHLALSDDGAVFRSVNNGRPVLWGQRGTRTLRDPYVGVGPGGLYHLLATDGWTSTSIVHATSVDLLDWSDQELVPVMAEVEGAHNAWAPEFFFDASTSLFHIVWSTCVDDALDGEDHDWQNVGQEHRIWGCTTPDFIEFSPAGVFFDPGYSVIDATVVPDGDGFVLALKDERGVNDLVTSHKHILVARSPNATGPYEPLVGPVSPGAVEGPSLFKRGNDWVLLFDHYLENRYGGATSVDGENWTPFAIEVPAGARHASVLELLEVPGWLLADAASATST